MGKSTAADMLRRMGIPVHDSDATVHRLMAPGGAALPAIETAFPGCVVDGAVDRRRLGAQVFTDPKALERLEAILHPMVTRESQRFLALQARHGHRLVALDIPLLLETGQRYRIDMLLVVSAPYFIQRMRVLARPGMTEERFKQILARQVPDAVKRRHADRIIPTGLGRGETWRHLAEAAAAATRLAEARNGRSPSAWPPRYRIRRGGSGRSVMGIWLDRFIQRQPGERQCGKS